MPADTAPLAPLDVENARTYSSRYATDALVGRKAKVFITLVWSGLVIGGILVAKQFILNLSTQVDPVAGTASYEATQVSLKYFPELPLNAALLVSSADKTALVEFVNESTCHLEFQIGVLATLELRCIPKSVDALGGGCMTKADFLTQLSSKLSNVTKNIPPFIMPPAKVQKLIDAAMNAAQQTFPNVTSCPVTSNSKLTRDWLTMHKLIENAIAIKFPSCNYTVLSLSSIPALSFNESFQIPVQRGRNLTVNMSVSLPAGVLWEPVGARLMTPSQSGSLTAVSVSACEGLVQVDNTPIAKDISNELKNVAANAPPSLKAKATSSMLMLDAVQAGITNTMDLSTMTLPMAILILAVMVKSLRLVLCTIINLIVCLTSSLLLAYPLTLMISVPTIAPSLMVAVALAMSIDYSLFLLSRFYSEVALGRTVPAAITVMLETSGRIVLVSGATLVLCFLVMLCLPLLFISSMGMCAAITVLMAVAAALTVTPVILHTFPQFFGVTKQWGITTEGCCVSCQRDDEENGNQGAQQETNNHTQGSDTLHEPDLHEHNAEEERQIAKSRWLCFGKWSQRLAWPTLVLLVALAVPFAVFGAARLKYSSGLQSLMPAGAEDTHTIMTLEDEFGMGYLFPTSLIMVPPPGRTSSQEGRDHWLLQACHALQHMAAGVNTDPTMPPFTSAAFAGAMIVNGTCTTSGLAAGAGVGESWSNVGTPFSATSVNIIYQADPFTSAGQAWIRRLRDATDKHKDVASWYVFGAGPIQMDLADKVFNAFPLMVALMMVIVLMVIGMAFKSVVAPIRAALSLLWMLVVTFGIAVFTFQDGCLDFLQWQQLGKRDTGAMYWMTPCMAFPIIVGLGLDYDIFYTERVVEERSKGHPDDLAATRALAATANVISAAGFIMVVAFSSLLLSSTPELNEIAFLLIIGVLIDCTITTKILIPGTLGLLGRLSFWPRRFQSAREVSPEAIN